MFESNGSSSRPGWRQRPRVLTFPMIPRGSRLVASLAQTRKLIQREKALSLRGRPPHSLLVFDIPAPVQSVRRLDDLIEVVRRRLRGGDQLGWVEDGRLVALLPATDSEGAAVVARDVRHLLHLAGWDVPVSVLSANPRGAADPVAPDQLAPRVRTTATTVRTSSNTSSHIERRRT